MKKERQRRSGEPEVLSLRDMEAHAIRLEGRHHIMLLLAMLNRQVAMVGLEEVIMGLELREDQRLLRMTAKTTMTTKPMCGRLKTP